MTNLRRPPSHGTQWIWDMEQLFEEQEVAERGVANDRTYDQQLQFEKDEAHFAKAEIAYRKRQEEDDLIRYYQRNVFKFSSLRARK